MINLGGLKYSPDSRYFISTRQNKQVPVPAWNYELIRPVKYYPAPNSQAFRPKPNINASLRGNILALLAARRLGPQREDMLPADLRAELGHIRESTLGIKLYAEQIEPLRMYEIDDRKKFVSDLINLPNKDIDVNIAELWSIGHIGLADTSIRIITRYRGEYYAVWMTKIGLIYEFSHGPIRTFRECKVIMHDPDHAHVQQMAANPYTDPIPDRHFRPYCCGLMSRLVGACPYI